MKKRPIVLSISMLISGRDEMFRSLESLCYFREAFPCEVILVDTGCSGEQRKRAEKYADKIVDFTWCDDFAAARNAGLKEACGEWFLYLDDDEWFDNPREIVTFFQSGECNNYNCASYVVRNYKDAEGKSYEETYPLRLARREPGLEFVGRIHEYLYPTRLPKKVFSDFVHHYGYVYKSTEERDKHAARNIEPLLEMCKEHPGDPRWTGQLAQEYFGLQKYEEVIEICQRGLEEWRVRKDQIAYMPAHVGLHYSYIITCMEILGKFKEEEDWLIRALEDSLSELEVMEPTVAYYCLQGIMLYHRYRKYELCRDFLRRYVNYAKRLMNNRAALENGTAAIVGGVFTKPSLYAAVLTGLSSAVFMEDYTLAEEAFYMLDWTDKGLMGQEEWEEEILDAFCSVEHHPLWVRMLQTLISRKGGMDEIQSVLIKTEFAYKQQANHDKLCRLQTLVAELDYDNYYILSMKILQAKENSEVVSDLFQQLFERYPQKLFEVNSEIWKVGKQAGVAMEPLFLQVDYRYWRRGLEMWSREAASEDFELWNERIAGWKTHSDIRYDFFTINYLEGSLRNYWAVCEEQNKCAELAEFEQILWQYADTVLAFNVPWLKKSLFEEMPEVLPDEVRLSLQLKELQQYREHGDELKCLETLRKCVGVYLPLELAIEEYAGMYREELQKREQEAEAAQKELKRLIGALKETAKLRIERNEYQAAKEILLQVQQCVPEDEEVKELLHCIAEE